MNGFFRVGVFDGIKRVDGAAEAGCIDVIDPANRTFFVEPDHGVSLKNGFLSLYLIYDSVDDMQLSVRNLTVSIGGRQILHNVSFGAESGETHAIRGPNGSGKTSLALSIIGHPAYAVQVGDIRWKDESVANLKPHERARRGIHWIPQSAPAFEGVGLLSLARAARDARGAASDVFALRAELSLALTATGLTDDFLLRALHGDSSGGEKKKVELAIAAVLKPELLILDEVDAGLDADGLAAAATLIRGFKKIAAIIVISHSESFLERLGVNRAYRMESGTLIHE